MLGLSPGELVIVLAITITGATLQGSIGTGYGLLSAPFLHLIDPAFVPAALVLSQMPLTSGMAFREREHVDRPGVTRALVGRLPGAVLGATMARLGGQSAIAIVVAIVLLSAVAASITKVHFRSTPRNVTIAGAVSGFTATMAGIGGPPMALTYQNDDPTTFRATLSAFFFAGGIMSATMLAISGVLGGRQLELGLMLIPGVVLGLYISRHIKDRIPNERFRHLVLATCAVSAVVLIVETLL